MKRYRVQLILRIVGVALTAGALVGLVLETRLYELWILVGALLAWQGWGLLREATGAVRDLTRLLEAVRASDFSQTLPTEGRGPLIQHFGAAFDEVAGDFKRLRAEKQEQVRYLENAFRHVGVALIAFRADGSVQMMNAAARRLLSVHRVRHIDTLGEEVSRPLADALQRLRSGEQRLVKVPQEGRALQLSVYATRFRLRGEEHVLASMQDIRNELEEKEMEAWQRLTRVLTHEITNSVAPIASLAGTARRLLGTEERTNGGEEERTNGGEEERTNGGEEERTNGGAEERTNGGAEERTNGGEEERKNGGMEEWKSGGVEEERRRDTWEALEVIERRSEALMSFVDAYRSFTHIPAPTFEMIEVGALFGRVRRLLQAQAEGGDIAVRSDIDPPGLVLTADTDLVEQVLINLVLNSVQALEEQPSGVNTAPQILLRSRPGANGVPFLQVIDNGPGIPADVQERLFVPFFTTKGDGSGIGLSLARQIMRLHGGSVDVQSDRSGEDEAGGPRIDGFPDAATAFTLRF